MMNNSDSATPRPGDRDSINCGVCAAAMDVRRNVHGPTGMVEAMSGGGHRHDSFRCPNIDEDWHVQVKMIRGLADKTPSRRIELALLEEAAEIVVSRIATKKVSRL